MRIESRTKKAKIKRITEKALADVPFADLIKPHTQDITCDILIKTTAYELRDLSNMLSGIKGITGTLFSNK